MAKLNQDTMFRIIDQVSDYLESNLGRDYTFKHEVDLITISFASSKAKAELTPEQVKELRARVLADETFMKGVWEAYAQEARGVPGTPWRELRHLYE